MHIKPIKGSILIFLLVFSFMAAADDVPTAEEYQLYSQALEKILREDTAAALRLLERLLEEYPETTLRDKAEMYLELYAHQYDRDGSIPFYLGWLGVAILTAESVPLILDIENIYVYSAAGILGVGAGLWSAYALTNNRNMSGAQDLWIESVMGVSMLHLFFTMRIFDELLVTPRINELIYTDAGKALALSDNWIDLNFISQATLAITSRLLTYQYMKDRSPSLGRIGFTSMSLAWGHAYYWPIMLGLIKSDNMVLNDSLGMIIPDAIAILAYGYWEKLGWSLTRSGIVSIGGIGGHLIAGFINMSLFECINDYPAEAMILLQLGCSLGAKILTVQLTKNIPADKHFDPTIEKRLLLTPVVTPGGFGIQGSLRL